MRLRLRIATAFTLLVALAAPAMASASGSAVIRDCTDDGALSKHYSQSDYAQALANLPADVDEYSDCRAVIRRAQLGGAGGGGSSSGGGTTGAGGSGGTGGGGSGDTGTGAAALDPDPLATATPKERASYAKAVLAGAAPVQLDGRPVTPGNLGGATRTSFSDIPTPLLAILALIALGGVGAAGLGARRLVHGRRTA